MQMPTGEAVISVPAAGGAAPGVGAAPGALAGAFAGPTLPPGLLPGNINSVVPAPPPRARPAAPPAPPIPRGAGFKPQWDELKDFTESDVIVSAQLMVLLLCFADLLFMLLLFMLVKGCASSEAAAGYA
jgi:hypothetical protein